MQAERKRSLKVYVSVKVDFDENGRMFPRSFLWETGMSTGSTKCSTSSLPSRRAQADKATGTGSGSATVRAVSTSSTIRKPAIRSPVGGLWNEEVSLML